jgi:photosystem II stability/assembly factor-like uncharacterized protein
MGIQPLLSQNNCHFMHRRIFILCVCLIVLTQRLVEAQWKIEISPTKNNLHSIALIDETSGWIVGDKGTILQKSNGKWNLLPAVTNSDLYSVCMTDINNVWAVGKQGTILHFNGSGWEKVSSPTNDDLFSVSFNDADNGIATGASGLILSFKNGIWSKIANRMLGNLFSVSYRNNVSYIAGEWECVRMPVIYMQKGSETVPGKLYSDSFFYLLGICTSSQNDLWAVGNGSGRIMHFDGQTWTDSFFDNNLPTLISVFFNDQYKGISVGFSGTIVTYSDYRWVQEESPTKSTLRGTAVSGTTYYAVGDDGMIVTCDKGIVSGINETGKQIIQNSISLYPNPCNGIVNIKVPVETNFVTNRIYIINIDGHVALNYKISPGLAELQIDTRSFDNGIYLIKAISTNLKTKSSKLLIIH